MQLATDLKKIAIWGAGPAGKRCFDRARDSGVDVAFFVDRAPPPTSLCMGRPVRHESEVMSSLDELAELDAIMIAFWDEKDRDKKKRLLHESGVRTPIVSWNDSMTFERLLQGSAPVLLKLFAYDHRAEDRNRAALVVGHVAERGPIVLYGAGRTGRYLLDVAPELRARVRAFVDDDPALVGTDVHGIPVVAMDALPPETTAVLVTATSWRTRWNMDRKLRAAHPSVARFSLDVPVLNDFTCHEPITRVDEKSIYPIEIPDMTIEPGLDFLLMDLPARFLGMMPNGLGFVHNLLLKTDVRFQTLDLDLVFYHRYHAERLLDGREKMVTDDGYEMKNDPWWVDHIEDEWSSPKAVAFFQREIDELVANMVAAKPKVIGLSLHGTNLLLCERMATIIREKLPETVLIVGGYDCVYPDVGPRTFSNFDYMVIGEAENSLPELLRRLLAGEKPKNLPGVISKNDSKLRPFQPAEMPHNLDEIDFPRYQWTDLRLYKNHNGYQLTPIVLGRGCRWSRCTFCAERFEWRGVSARKMVDEIEWLYERECRIFQFNDSDLSSDPDTVAEVCEEIIRRKIQAVFTGQLRVHKKHNRAYFDRMKAAGFSALRFGVDAWTDHTLRLMNKGYNISMMKRVVQECHEAGISVAANLVIGVPGETDEDVDGTIENIISLKNYVSAIENVNTLILARGGLYWDDPEKYNIKFRIPQDKVKTEIFGVYAKMIPSDLWYSVDPYIDQEVRVRRMNKIVDACMKAGVYLGDYAEWKARKLSKAMTEGTRWNGETGAEASAAVAE